MSQAQALAVSVNHHLHPPSETGSFIIKELATTTNDDDGRHPPTTMMIDLGTSLSIFTGILSVCTCCNDIWREFLESIHESLSAAVGGLVCFAWVVFHWMIIDGGLFGGGCSTYERVS